MMHLRLILVLALMSGCGNHDLTTAHAAPIGNGPLRTTSTIAAPPAAAVKDLLAATNSPLAEIAQGTFVPLKKFYDDRAYRPLWIDATGLRPEGRQLLSRLAQTRGSRWSGPEAAAERYGGGAALELLLSAAYAETAIDPRNPAGVPHGSGMLIAAAAASDLAVFLRNSLPVDPEFWRLRGWIGAYREIARRGGWRPIPPGNKLEIGAQGPRVAALRRRLLVTGDLAASETISGQFDDQLSMAVKAFQVRHGLAPDGIVGAETLAALNVPIERRLATMEFNLSRMLKEERAWGRRYIAVNAAAASYRFVEAGRSVLERPAIVGKPGWPTPRIDSVIHALEFHPYWTVPPSIAKLEVWPKVRRDADYLRRNHMRIVDGQIRQDPGADNPLGLVKFIFPSPYSVYLHDTNHPELFTSSKRFRSHGCVRISGAMDLARALLKDNADWPNSRLDEAIDGTRNIRIELANPIPIHITYDTAWVDDAGMLQFRDDIYRRDRLETAALQMAAAETAEACRD